MLCPGRGRLVEKDRAKTQTAANGFFQNPQAFDGAAPIAGKFAAGKGPAQLFDQGIVPAFNAT